MVESTSLLTRQGLKALGGSNPLVSAKLEEEPEAKIYCIKNALQGISFSTLGLNLCYIEKYNLLNL